MRHTSSWAKWLFSCLPVFAVHLFASHLFATNAIASEDEQPAWDVNNPPYDTRTINIDTQSLTWANLDVSPDGSKIVFDTLGDIYLVDITGGQATALTQSMAWDMHPTFSPDGKSIAFITDQGGTSNLWTMNVDGENWQQISKEKTSLIHTPVWHPNGDYIAVTKGTMSSRSIPAGAIWLYHKTGGDGVALKERAHGEWTQKNITDPAFSVDGEYLYFSADTTAGRVFKYNRNPLEGLFSIQRINLEDGEQETIVSGPGGAVAPELSPDGKLLAFIRRENTNTVLFIKDLKTGLETRLNANMERDMQEGFGSEGGYAYFDWTPDSKAIVFWSGGNIQKIDVASKQISVIPVQVKTEMKIADALRYPVQVAPDTFDIKVTRWAQKSPDGEQIIFQALGKLYVRDIETGKTKRLTKQTRHDEFYPRYSKNGKHIVFTTWNDETLGSVRVVRANGRGEKVVSTEPGHYVQPSFNNAGDKVVFKRFTGGHLLSPEYSMAPGIYVADINNKQMSRVIKSGDNPHFSANGKRIFYTDYQDSSYFTQLQLNSVDLDGDNKKEHFKGDKVTEFRVSPDGKWIAFTYQYNAYIAPFVKTGKVRRLGAKSTWLPVQQVSKRAGEYLNWTGDAKALQWSHGPRFFERQLTDAFAFLEGAPETLPEPESEGILLSFTANYDKPSGKIALVGGKVVTMRNADNEQEIIENGVVLVEGNRITAVGVNGGFTIPSDAKVIDVSGKTLIPGILDAHSHGSQGSNEIIPQHNWINYSSLAFGVTTVHDPSNDTSEIFSAAELAKTGKIKAPRIFSTGTILYGAKVPGYTAIINNLDDAKFHLQRLKDYGAISVKSYNQPRRDQRQQVLQAARELELMVVPEGGGKFYQNMTMIVDGHTGLEHALPIARAYDDVDQLWSQTEVGYNPTFVVAYGGIGGEAYWYDKTQVWKNPRLMRYTPKYLVEPLSIRRPSAPEDHYNHKDVAAYAKQVRQQGVRVVIGPHGEREGLGAHWEMWMMAQGGFTPWQALRGATYDGAKHLGMDKDIGSIEVGKLADIAIIDGNPLEDIRQSELVSHTMINGRLYHAKTMTEVDSKQQPFNFFFHRLDINAMPEATSKALHDKQHRYHWKH